MKKYCLVLLSGVTLFGCHEGPKEKIMKAANKERRTVSGPKMTFHDTGSKIDVSAALNFVNGYVDNMDKLDSINEIGAWVAASPYVTATYKEIIKSEINEINNDSETILDDDIIFDTQDYPEEGFELESIDEKTGLIVLRGKKWKDFKLNVKLAEENGQWLVDESGNF